MKCLRFFLLFFGAACFFPSLCRRHFDSSVPSRRAAPICRYLTFHVRGALSTTSLLLARVNMQQRARKADFPRRALGAALTREPRRSRGWGSCFLRSRTRREALQPNN